MKRIYIFGISDTSGKFRIIKVFSTKKKAKEFMEYEKDDYTLYNYEWLKIQEFKVY